MSLLKSDVSLRKNLVSVFILVIGLVLLIATVPTVHPQTASNVQLLSTTSYLSTSDGDLVVVGEIQNQGSTTVSNVLLQGQVYSSGSNPVAVGIGEPVVDLIAPQEKVPFLMDFSAASFTGGLGWNSVGVNHVDVVISAGNVTTEMPYTDVQIINSTSSLQNTSYMVTGYLQNLGNFTTNMTRVYARFYDSSHMLIALSQTDYLNPPYYLVSPGKTLPFAITLSDAPTTVIGNIQSYELLIQNTSVLPLPSNSTETPTPSGQASPTASSTQQLSSTVEPSPAINPTATSQPTASPTNTLEPGQIIISINTLIAIIAIVAAVIIIIVAAALLLRTRKRQPKE
jgi:hypothetical protein